MSPIVRHPPLHNNSIYADITCIDFASSSIPLQAVLESQDRDARMEEVDTEAERIKMQTRARQGLRTTRDGDEPVSIRKVTAKRGAGLCPPG